MMTRLLYDAIISNHKKEIEVKDTNNKLLKLGAFTLLGIGVGVGASIIYKKNKLKHQAEHEYYMDRLEEYISEQEATEYNDNIKKNIQDELEKKVSEFNERRLSYENEAHVSKEDLEKYTEDAQIKDDKIVNEEYKENEYDKYEVYDNDLKKEN